MAAGATQLTVDGAAIRGAAATLAAGDMLIVMQVQDAEFNNANGADYGDGAGGLQGAGYTALNNSGVYEYVVAQSGTFTGGTCPAGSTCITIRGTGPGDGLMFSYATVPRDDSGGLRRGQRTFQVVRVPRYASATLGAGLTAAAWDGRSGGVLAVDVAGDLALGGGLASADGLGFRGGVGESVGGGAGMSNNDYRRPNTLDAHGRKGEGIACTPDVFTEVPGGSGTDGCPQGDRARGGPGNSGGGGTDGDPDDNDENSGGGGGGNGGAGGVGGNSWSSNLAVGGRGGAAVPAANGRLIMGGGGGAGTSNNAGPGHGTAGGGIVMVRAGSVSGTGTFRSRGPNAACSAQDGGGGGGAGGSILVYAESGDLASLTVLATGGRGGDANIGACTVSGGNHGPGAGGGGGVVFASGAVAGGSSVTGGASGLTTTGAYGATAGGNGPVIDTTLLAAEIPGVQACTVATRASLSGLRVSPGLVEFATSTQRRTAGFNVYASPDGRTAGRGVRLNETLLRAPITDSVTPILYRADVRHSDEPFVVLEEVETSGRRRLLGAFARGDERLEQALARIEGQAGGRTVRETSSARLVVRRTEVSASDAFLAPSRNRSDRSERVRAVKVEVAQAGPVTVPLADLAAAGLSTQSPESLQVWNFGQVVPRTVAAGALSFQAEALSTDYTGRNVYVVSGPGAPPAPSVTLTRSGPPLPAGFTRVGESVLYVPFIHPKARPWIWDFLTSDWEPAPLAFDLPGLAGGEPAIVTVRLHLAAASPQRHEVEAVLNGVLVGSARWKGAEPAVLSGSVPRSALLPAGNELRLRYSATPVTELDAGLAFVGALDLGLTLPPAPSVAPERLAAYDPSRPPFEGADYLILTHADFMEAALRLADLERGQGLNPLVVDVERAYDRHAAGAFDAAAVRALIQEYAKSGSARYVVLLGDDTYDPRLYQGGASRPWVPSLMGWDGLFGRVASENRYADVDGDNLPDLAIGRLPANTPAEAAVMLDKIERTMGGAPRDRPHVIAVDNQDVGDVAFIQLAAQVKAFWTGPFIVADAGGGFGAARQALLSGLKGDPRTLHYFGHGGPEKWAEEGLLVRSDMAGLAGTGGTTVLFTWACEAQWYQFTGAPSINEELLLVPGGGVAATFGPAGISDPHLQKALSERLYKALAGGLPLGDAIRAAKRDALAANPGAEPLVEGWHLLGDPALSLGSTPFRGRLVRRK